MTQGRSDFVGHVRLAADEIAAEVFDLFPYGIIVADDGGAVLAANDAARALLGDSELGVEQRTCCQLFGCGEHPLEDVCLSALAVATGEPLPELRLDRDASPYGALWVTAAPLGDQSSRVVFHVRPGDP